MTTSVHPLLDLSTLEPERPTIKIDGQSYELAVRDDFGLAKHARLARLQKRVTALHGKDEDLTDDEVATLTSTFDELVAMLLPGVPGDVRAKLRDGQRMAVCQAFFTANGVTRTPTEPPTTEPLPTGASSSPASNDSTAAAPEIG